MKTVCFGEIMLRLSPPEHQRFVQASQFDATFGGGEANVAVSLAQFGHESHYVSRVPAHEIGEAAINALRRFGVRTDHVQRGGDRLGVYFLENGASQRPSKVIYDRTGAAIAGITPGMVEWSAVLAGAHWFHVTGITPALSESAAETAIAAVRQARHLGVPVSCDLNYRKKLWSRDRAEKVMAQVMENVDLVIANEEDADMVFGIRAVDADVQAGSVQAESYRSVAEQLIKRFPTVKQVAITLRESLSASDNRWSAIAWDGKEFVRSRTYAMHIVDRVGGGDAFAAGLIHGLLHRQPIAQALEFGVAASCLKHTIPGDFNHVTVAEVEYLVKGGGSGRVQR